LSYTRRYGLTYKEWAEEKARRIRDALIMFYRSGAPVDPQILAERIYMERLWRVSKESWKPVHDRFTDFKPSPFIKNFISYLVMKLIEDGYISYGWTVESYDRVRVSDADTPVELSKARIHSYGILNRFIEVSDSVAFSEPHLEASPPHVKVTRLVGLFIAEARDAAHVSDETVKPGFTSNPPETMTVHSKRVLRIPSIEYLMDICIWKDPG